MAAEEDGSFLQRWSRRKQQATRVAPPSGTPDPVAEAARKAEADAAEVLRLAEEEAARAEVVARLPKLEELGVDSDFRLFMHPLVPPALRSAALAKMWTLDPTIRDFVGPARDYAWDWNVPGGVPGGGPAPSLSEVEATLRKLTARLDSAEPTTEAPQASAVPLEEGDRPRSGQGESHGDVAGDHSPATSQEQRADSPPGAAARRLSPSSRGTAGSALPDPATPALAEPGTPEPPRRRHGGATPA